MMKKRENWWGCNNNTFLLSLVLLLRLLSVLEESQQSVGAAVSKLTSNYLRRKRRENMRREGPPSPFNRLLGPVLLEGPGAAEAAATAGSAAAAAAGAGAAGGSTSSILSFFRPKNKFKEIFTNNALGEKGSLTALYFTGKGVEQILQAKGYVPFTPRLESIVRAAKQNGKKLNVVFISADNSPNDAADLFNTMPWYAVPFDDEEGRSITRSLYRKFRVSSLPHITLLDEQGKVVNPQAYTALLTDPLGFPWKKKSILQLIGNKLQDNKGQPVDPAVLKGKTIEKLIKDIDDALDVIAEEPVLLTFLNNADNQQQQQTLKALEEAAVALKGRKDGESVGPLPQFL
ncbi:nucleoredoxin, putative [Eimeria maxima]|uniref:Nucleoredoxin, putative n=1 Tax=Eimeria maxima TaxID=5804 RepID=U6LZD1_EIMMA|nr:nucleoredoxin, putative [Eimeria maxima]CDJ57332.1 nucleoredoxin, putative [Eimeria maxima]